MTVAQRHTRKVSECVYKTSAAFKSQSYFYNLMTLLIQILRKCSYSNKELFFINYPSPCMYLLNHTKHSPPPILCYVSLH